MPPVFYFKLESYLIIIREEYYFRSAAPLYIGPESWEETTEPISTELKVSIREYRKC